MNFTELLIAREKELGRPVRVGLAGAGQMGSGLAAQIGKIPGMSLVACADIDTSRAENALKLAGIETVKHNSDACLLYTSPSPRDQRGSRMPSSA